MVSRSHLLPFLMIALLTGCAREPQTIALSVQQVDGAYLISSSHEDDLVAIANLNPGSQGVIETAKSIDGSEWAHIRALKLSGHTLTLDDRSVELKPADVGKYVLWVRK